MGEIWIPEATRLGDGVIGGAMDTPNAPPRAVWHTTEGSYGSASAFRGTADYLIEKGYEPHILYDPSTDALGQFGPLNQSAKALGNAGSVRTNRTGRVCIQIEVMAKASKPFTGYWKPGPNFRALMRAIRSWGVPDTFPAGRLSQSGSDDVSRSLAIWNNQGGHFGHCNIPGNDHWDPGAIDRTALLSGGATTPTPSPQEDDMPTPAEIWGHLLDIPDGRQVSASTVLAWTDNRHNVIYGTIKGVEAKVEAQAAAVAALTAAVAALTARLDAGTEA